VAWSFEDSPNYDHEDNPQKHLSKLTDREDKVNNMGGNWLHHKKHQGSHKKGKEARKFQDQSNTEYDEESIAEKQEDNDQEKRNVTILQVRRRSLLSARRNILGRINQTVVTHLMMRIVFPLA